MRRPGSAPVAAQAPRGPAAGLLLMLPTLVRIEVFLYLILGLYITVTQSRPDLIFPTAIDTDPSNYYAAGLRLNAGHAMYALVPGDRLVTLNPPAITVPLLSPPFLGVIWRPLALLGDSSMLLWWAGGLLTLVGATLFVSAHTSIIRNQFLLLLIFPWIALAAVSGNVNPYLDAICLGVAVAASRGKSTTAGVLIAIAAAIKLTPVLLIVWFIIQRDWRAVRAFLVAALVIGVIQLVGAGLDSNLAYLAVMRDTAATGASFLSLIGIFHTLGAPEALANAAPLAAVTVGIGLAWTFRRRPAVGWVALVFAVMWSSPVVLVGNFAILLAAMWPITPARQARPSAVPREALTLAPAPSAGAALADP